MDDFKQSLTCKACGYVVNTERLCSEQHPDDPAFKGLGNVPPHFHVTCKHCGYAWPMKSKLSA